MAWAPKQLRKDAAKGSEPLAQGRPGAGAFGLEITAPKVPHPARSARASAFLSPPQDRGFCFGVQTLQVPPSFSKATQESEAFVLGSQPSKPPSTPKGRTHPAPLLTNPAGSAIRPSLLQAGPRTRHCEEPQGDAARSQIPSATDCWSPVAVEPRLRPSLRGAVR